METVLVDFLIFQNSFSDCGHICRHLRNPGIHHRRKKRAQIIRHSLSARRRRMETVGLQESRVIAHAVQHGRVKGRVMLRR